MPLESLAQPVALTIPKDGRVVPVALKTPDQALDPGFVTGMPPAQSGHA